MIRSIRGFIGLVTHIQMNNKEGRIVPRTTIQDDVENYFSLQRGRIVGSEATVQQYMQGNSTLAKGLLIKVEKQDINLNSFIGSYNYAIPLKRKRNAVERNEVKVMETKCNLFQHNINQHSEEEVSKFHTQKR